MALSNGMMLKERYRIESVLGQGGMGAVYQAYDELLGIPVAVKENLFLSGEYTRQFEQETKILASVKHHSLPRVVDFCCVPGQGQYLVMDYIAGDDLRDLIKKWGKLDQQDVILIGYHICDALEYLHQQVPPVVHRDIKPGNIKVTSDHRVYLVDFGLAKQVENPQQLTITGARAMTPGYSPPEQYGTARTDARSDIYSLGATLFHALTGSVPDDALDRITNKGLRSLHWENQHVIDSELINVINRSLAIEPDDRFQTAAEFKRALLSVSGLENVSEQARALSFFRCLPESTPAQSTQSESEASYLPKQKRHSVQPADGKKGRPLRHTIFISAIILAAIVGLFSLNTSLSNQVRSLLGIEMNDSLVQLGPTQIPTKTVTHEVTELPAASVSKQSVATQMPTPSLTIPSRTPTSEMSALTPQPTRSPTQRPAQPSMTPPPEVLLPAEDPGNFLAEDYPIVFASNRSGTMQLWLMDQTGETQLRLTDMPEGACQPDWSPDGTQIIFVSPCRSVQEYYEDSLLYVYDFLDESIIPLIGKENSEVRTGNFEPAWSPDGKSVVFTSVHTGIPHIFLYQIENRDVIELSNSPLEDRYPSWHPDGQRIIFSRFRVNWVIWEINIDGNGLNQVSLSGNVNNVQPVWAPDGKYVLFSQSNESRVPWLVKLFTGNFGSTLENNLYAQGSEFIIPILGPKFSQNGDMIIFESWPDGTNRDIYTMKVDGSDLVRLTTSIYYDIDPDWR